MICGFRFFCLSLYLGVCFATVFFEENFNDPGCLKSWVKGGSSNSEINGDFALRARNFSDDPKNLGLVTTEDARFYWLSKECKMPFSNRNKTLVIQFSVSFQQDIDCGGGYIKLYPSNTTQSDLNGTTPYYIMFGPDVCKPEKEVIHAIFAYKGRNVEATEPVSFKSDIFTHVYTLVVYPNKTYSIKVDNNIERTGDLEDDYSFNEPKMIRDPNATKPKDWNDTVEIDDPKDTKPADWDQPEFIKDPKSVKPADWDDAIDGEWKPATTENPEYKGEWQPRKIPNPDYKGPWTAPMIPNPNYVFDSSIAEYDDIQIIGIDIWQVKSGTVYDNMLITDDEELAFETAEKLKKLYSNETLTKTAADKAEEDETVEADVTDDEHKHEEL